VIDFSDPSGIIAFVLAVFVIFVGDFILFNVIRRWFMIVYIVLCELLLIICGIIPGTQFLAAVVFAFFIIGVIAGLFANISEYRAFVANAFKGRSGVDLFKRRYRNKMPEEIFDREEVYEKVYTAIVDMSRLKMGCLITFMKKDNLLDDSKVGTIIKQRGVDINAPVSTELLETIFYEGTRLHDGAVVIKDDRIVRAAVFFTSTARPLTGKYGSRHQAAIGISENSDSVTVVVSEETGRISIAFQGELTPVTPDNFLRVFEDDMAFESREADEGDDVAKKPSEGE
jgi:DNA integrity scanning protein DisA with diadenylate cyclase activity